MRNLTPVAVASALLMAASLAWTVHGVVARPVIEPPNLVLAVVSMWVATVASVAGMLVARGRWARRLGVAVGTGHAVLAILGGDGPVWYVAVALSAMAVVSVAGPWLNGIVRSLPAASGPPTRAVLVPLVLVGVPFVLAVADPPPLPSGFVGFGALAAAFWYIRAFPGAVAAVRVGWPLLAVTLAWPLGVLGGIVSAVTAVVVLVMAWHPSVARAVHPLDRATLVPIPPELAPKDILDAAGLDNRGRRR